jgi:hypothetical protein
MDSIPLEPEGAHGLAFSAFWQEQSAAEITAERGVARLEPEKAGCAEPAGVGEQFPLVVFAPGEEGLLVVGLLGVRFHR